MTDPSSIVSMHAIILPSMRLWNSNLLMRFVIRTKAHPKLTFSAKHHYSSKWSSRLPYQWLDYLQCRGWNNWQSCCRIWSINKSWFDCWWSNILQSSRTCCFRQTSTSRCRNRFMSFVTWSRCRSKRSTTGHHSTSCHSEKPWHRHEDSVVSTIHGDLPYWGRTRSNHCRHSSCYSCCFLEHGNSMGRKQSIPLGDW